MSRRTHDGGKAIGAESGTVRRWEYLQVDVHVETWTDSVGRSGRVAISEAEPGQVPSVLGLLNELGSQGWELAGVSNTQSSLIYRMLFKRRATGAR
jgi:hypothetical protein